eukprot:CAMPEP_0195092394 /NCGR_PEP_ID=MMETSP0448-20130528/36467_1 /TAXON_ID=66468 /ORGANISM="Heterocapsa triquestra, Strain CCMP 448" /LENGTH=46 /DNA_ID= /DNA_START= /DNA_END= /DNA_ORIENTATION=
MNIVEGVDSEGMPPPEDEFDEFFAHFLYGERDSMPKGYAIRTGLSD